MNLAPVTENLGLPPAPELFTGLPQTPAPDGWNPSPLLAPWFAPPPDPPPDPHQIYCPAGMELYDYQEQGVRFLTEHPVALLGDEMGLGKSIQAIAAMRLLIHRGDVRRAVILCPKTLVSDWLVKLRQWAPDLPVVLLDGKKKSRIWAWQRAEGSVYLTAYETFREDLKQGLAEPQRFDMVILDEIQRIKNPVSVTHLAVAAIPATWRWGLSGTPLENRVKELVGIFAYLEPGLLPPDRPYPPAVVSRIIAPYVLRRCKEDVLHHLPPKEHRTEWLELSYFQRQAYIRAEREAREALRQAGASEVPTLALSLLNRLKQICNLDPASGASCKMDYLEQALDRIVQAGEKALIYSQYPTVTLRALLPRLERFGTWLFDGSLSDFSRQIIVHCFQQKEQPRVLAMSLKCGGVGLTLTRANHVFHFDSWWNPASAQQAEDRTHRIGQKKPVYVTTLLTRGTVEERIAELMEQKRELFRKVMGPLTTTEAEERAVARRLSREEVLGLFGLRPSS
ncbi:MAG TPA: DEAD/DEAH box helicase [Symbiobacteriaceae bacterium]